MQSELGTPLEATGNSVSCRTAEPQRALYRLVGWAEREGIALEGIEVQRPTLEDVFLELTRSAA
jgi:ABC-2 type transport system ATP-binding protein